MQTSDGLDLDSSVAADILSQLEKVTDNTPCVVTLGQYVRPGQSRGCATIRVIVAGKQEFLGRRHPVVGIPQHVSLGCAEKELKLTAGELAGQLVTAWNGAHRLQAV